LVGFFPLHQFPNFTRGVAGSGDMLPPEPGVALSPLDVGMSENLGQLVQIAAVHHVPGSESVTQVVEPEVRYLRSPEQILEPSFESAPAANCTLWP